MKKSIFKTSLLVTLSTLFVACGSHNHTSVNKETQKQPQQSQKPAPQTKPQANSQDKAPQEKPNNTEQSSSSSMQAENSTQNHSTEAEKQQKPSNPEQSMNTENSTDKKEEMNNMDTRKNNPSKNTQSDIPNSMANNDRPNTQANLDQMPPKTNNQTNSNKMSSEDKGRDKDKEKENQMITEPNPEEIPQSDIQTPPRQSKPGDWKAKLYDPTGHARDSELDPESISSSGSIISLKLGKNKQNNYEFTLLGENEEVSLYYGYHLFNVQYQEKTIKIYEMIHGINQNQINSNPIPNTFSAEYKKDKGFLYSIFSDPSNISIEKQAPQYADITITYQNGSSTGKVTKINESQTTLFNITDNISKDMSNYTLTVTPTGQETRIENKESAQFNVYFVDSTNNKGDRKYIAGRGVSSGKKWGGVFAAEKQN